MLVRLLVTVGLLLANAMAAPTASAGTRIIARHGGLVASVPDNFRCGPDPTIVVDSPDGSAYSGDRIALQILIALVRAALDGECTRVNSISFNGRGQGVVVWQGRVSAAQGWQLPPGPVADARPQPAPPPQTSAEAARKPHNSEPGLDACEYDPEQPLVGCWWQFSPDPPAHFTPAITVFQRSGRMFGGTPRQLAEGQLAGLGVWRRQRMYGYGQIIDVRRQNGSWQQFQAPEFFDHCSFMKLTAYGAELLFKQFLGSPRPFIMVRLNVRRITPTVLDDERELLRVGQFLAEDSKHDACVDPGQPNLLDEQLEGLIRSIFEDAPSPGLRMRAIAPRARNRVSAVVARSNPSRSTARPPAQTRPKAWVRPDPQGDPRGRWDTTPSPAPGLAPLTGSTVPTRPKSE